MVTLYTTEELAEFIGVPYKTVWYALITGRIKESKRIGRFRLFDDYDVTEVQRYFNDRKKGKET